MRITRQPQIDRVANNPPDRPPAALTNGQRAVEGMAKGRQAGQRS